MIKLKINGLFSLNLETLFTKHSPPETLSLSLEMKALYFKWNFLKLSTITKIEKCLLLFTANTNILIILYRELNTECKNFIFAICHKCQA